MYLSPSWIILSVFYKGVVYFILFANFLKVFAVASISTYEYTFSIYELKKKPASGQEYKALQDAINPIFRLLNGIIICPEEDKSFTRFIVALEKADNPKLKKEFSKIVRKQNNNILEALS